MTVTNGRPIRAAVVGLGNMGMNHVRILREFPGLDVVALCDADPERLASLARNSTARAYTDYREMLAKEQLDMVSIAVPTRAHAEVAAAAIRNGIHLMLEKPIAATVSDAQELKSQAEAASVRLAVGHIERFNPAVAELKRQIDLGRVGQVWQLHATRSNPFSVRDRDIGVIHDLATHDIDIMRFLLGTEVEEVSAQVRRGVKTPFEDLAVGWLRFANGTIGLIDVNWMSPTKVRTLEVLGERGALILDYSEQTIAARDKEGPSEVAGTAGKLVGSIPLIKGEPLRLELAAFVEAIVSDRQPAVSASDAIAALVVADCLVAAADTGEVIRVSRQVATLGPQ